MRPAFVIPIVPSQIRQWTIHTPVGVWQTAIDVVYVGAVIVIDLVVDLVQGTLL